MKRVDIDYTSGKLPSSDLRPENSDGSSSATGSNDCTSTGTDEAPPSVNSAVPEKSVEAGSSVDSNSRIIKCLPKRTSSNPHPVRNILPRRELPRCLNPNFVDINPNRLPLCWYGIPYSRSRVVRYAKEVDLAVPIKRRNGPVLHGTVDEFKTWGHVRADFEEKTGISMDILFVWGQTLPILVFFTNRELEVLSEDAFECVKWLLEDMHYPEDCRLMWYLDRRELM